ncbi:MAG TPA: acyltransferase family protein [Steroidobacteraceae bacterium]|nr:acyltransferase family protein [Steroidobacteraceae bacterium]
MNTPDRLHALDALRAFALFLGIYFHASLSYVPGVEEWVVTDTSTSPMIWLVSGFSHLFRMSLFFFIAGYFARLVYHRKGFGYFVRDRARRIALPLLMFLPVMLVLLGIIWAWGAREMGRALPDPPPIGVRYFPLTHLWFLYYLLLMYVAALAGRQLVVSLLDRSERIRQFLDKALLRLLKKRVAPFAFGLPLALVALAAPEWNPPTGIPTPDKSLIPQLIPTVGFGSAFVVGWFCQRSMTTLTTMAERTTSSVLIALACFVITVAMGFTIGRGQVPASWLPVARFVAGLVLALTLWYWNLFLIGFALKRLSAPSGLRRYWADSSYWLYIAHLPLVTALQVVALQVDWHWSIELTLVLAISVGLLLLSYKYLVRPTWLGAILNGARRPPLGLEQAVAKATA